MNEKDLQNYQLCWRAFLPRLNFEPSRNFGPMPNFGPLIWNYDSIEVQNSKFNIEPKCSP